MDIQIPNEKEINEMNINEVLNWAGKLISVQATLTRAQVAVANRLKVINDHNIELQSTLIRTIGDK